MPLTFRLSYDNISRNSSVVWNTFSFREAFLGHFSLLIFWLVFLEFWLLLRIYFQFYSLINYTLVVYKMRVLPHFAPWGIFRLECIITFCPPGVFLGLRVLAHFELYQIFVCWSVQNIFFCYLFWNKLSQKIR